MRVFLFLICLTFCNISFSQILVIDHVETGKLNNEIVAALQGENPNTVKKLVVNGFASLNYEDCRSIKNVFTESVNSLDLSNAKFENNKMPNADPYRIGAFSYFNELTTVSLPVNLKAIGSYAFSGCGKLSMINFPSMLDSIGRCAFENCKKLKTIYSFCMPPKLEDYVFLGVTASSIELRVLVSDTIKYKPIIPWGNMRITPSYAIYANISSGRGFIEPMNNVLIPIETKEPVYIIPDIGYAVADVKLDGISVKNDLVKKNDLEAYIFNNLSSNHNIDVSFKPIAEGHKQLVVAVFGSGKIEGNYNGQTINSFPIEVPNNASIKLKSTGPKFLYWEIDNKKIEDAEITLQMNENKKVSAVFSLYISHEVKNISEEIASVLENANTAYIPSITFTGAEPYTWRDCRIISSAFGNTAIFDFSGAKFPDNKIPDTGSSYRGAFEGLTELQQMVFPANLEHIGFRAFYGCAKLGITSLPASVKTLSDYAFYECEKLSLKELPSGLVSIGKRCFFDCSGLAITEIPTGISTIEEYAFYRCIGLRNLIFPYSLDSIKNYAFYDCMQIVITQLPQNLKHIGNYSFYNCVRLTISELPAKLENIGENAFENCLSLVSLTIPINLGRIRIQAFKDCKYLKTIYNNCNVPPIVGLEAFTGVTLNKVDLYIKNDSYSYYTTTTPWKDMNIRVFDEGVKITKDTFYIAKSASEKLEANVIPENAYNKNISWKIVDTNIATVNSNGIITAKQEGITYVIAKSSNSNIGDTCVVVIGGLGMDDVTLDEAKSKNLFSIYPNPSFGEVNIIFQAQDISDKTTLSIFDLRGNLVQTIKITTSINRLSQLKSGVYFLKVECGNKSQMEKIIIL